MHSPSVREGLCSLIAAGLHGPCKGGPAQAATVTVPLDMKIRVLGPLEVAIDGVEVDLGGSRPRTLLGILIANRPQAVSVDRLIDEMWGESPPPSAVGTLQAYVSRLRAVLGEKVIVRRRSGYALDLPVGTVDADVLAESTPLEGSDEPSRLASRLGLWRGRPFEDVADTPSISQERTRLEELRMALLESRIDNDLAAGRYQELIAELEGLVAANPYRERLAGQLMLALYQAGRQTEALGVFASMRKRLVDELGLSPSPELASLEESILRQSPGLAPPAPATRHNLPAARSTFVGRRSEIEGVSSRLQETRLVTLTGAGGSGKTRLALEISRSLLGRYKDGVWWVELDQITDPGLLDDTVAAALGLIGTGEGLLPERRQGPVTSQALVDALAGKESLVVLDNCEHLVDATAALVDKMLDRCPGLTILATSRERLAVPGEVVWPVLPLEVIESGAGEAGDAVELFMERARAALPTFQVDQDGVRVVAEICRRLDGMPLAIELAAARVRAFGLPEIAAKLENRLRFLSGGSRTAHSRLQSLASTVEWSYNLLSNSEQALFGRLAPFRSWFSLEAVERVAAFEPIAPGDASGLLAALVDKSMVHTRFDGGSHRYRLLETMRDYASALLTGPERAALMARFTDYYIGVAESGLSHLHDPQQLLWLRRFEDEQPNFRAALDHLVVVGSHDEAMRLTGALGEFWVLRGLVGEARSWIDRVLGSAPGADVRWKARVLGTASSIAEMAGQPEAAHAFATEALAAFEEVGDMIGRAGALRLRAVTGAAGRRDPSDLDEATAASRDAGDHVGLAWCLLERAMTVFWKAGYTEMLDLAEEARRLFEGLGDKLGIANALLVEARASHLLGRKGASELLQEALALFRQAGARPAIAWTLYDLAEVLAASDDDSAGDRTYREAVAEFDAVGIRFGTAVGYGSWGWWARRAGHFELSADRFHRALAESLEIRQTGTALWVFELIAGLAGDIGLLEEAAVLFGAAERWRGELSHPMPAWDLARYGADLARVRAELSEGSFVAQWERGAALSWDQTVAVARGITDQVGTSTTTQSTAPTRSGA